MDHGHPYDAAVGGDFRFYYEAGRGNFDFKQIQDWDGKKVVFQYFYPRWTAALFFWCRYMEFEQAYLAWSVFLTICFIILAWEACNYGFAGTVMAVAGVKFFSICIGTGNIIPFLALLVLNPVTCLLAACYKCWLLCFLPRHFLLALRQHSQQYHRHSVEIHWESVRLSLRTAALIIVPAAAFFLTYERYYRLILAGLPSVRGECCENADPEPVAMKCFDPADNATASSLSRRDDFRRELSAGASPHGRQYGSPFLDQFLSEDIKTRMDSPVTPRIHSLSLFRCAILRTGR